MWISSAASRRRGRRRVNKRGFDGWEKKGRALPALFACWVGTWRMPTRRGCQHDADVNTTRMSTRRECQHDANVNTTRTSTRRECHTWVESPLYAVVALACQARRSHGLRINAHAASSAPPSTHRLHRRRPHLERLCTDCARPRLVRRCCCAAEARAPASGAYRASFRSGLFGHVHPLLLAEHHRPHQEASSGAAAGSPSPTAAWRARPRTGRAPASGPRAGWSWPPVPARRSAGAGRARAPCSSWRAPGTACDRGRLDQGERDRRLVLFQLHAQRFRERLDRVLGRGIRALQRHRAVRHFAAEVDQAPPPRPFISLTASASRARRPRNWSA
jgi:hypothetical protein